MAPIYTIYKAVNIIVAAKNVIVSFDGFVENISYAKVFFAYSGGGYYEIANDFKSFLFLLQSGKEFVDNMKKMCQTIGLVYEPLKNI